MNLLIDNKTKENITPLIDDIANKIQSLAGTTIILLNNGPIGGDFAYMVSRSHLRNNTGHSVIDTYAQDKREWESLIVVSDSAVKLYNEYPSFFCFILGHEIGHAHICNSDSNLHVFSLLVFNFINGVGGDFKKWEAFPHENIYDKYGKYLAESIFGAEKTKVDLENIIKDKKTLDVDRIKYMLQITSSDDLSNVKRELQNFAKPYKQELIKAWENDMRWNKATHNSSITDYAEDFQKYFK